MRFESITQSIDSSSFFVSSSSIIFRVIILFVVFFLVIIFSYLIVIFVDLLKRQYYVYEEQYRRDYLRWRSSFDCTRISNWSREICLSNVLSFLYLRSTLLCKWKTISLMKTCRLILYVIFWMILIEQFHHESLWIWCQSKKYDFGTTSFQWDLSLWEVEETSRKRSISKLRLDHHWLSRDTTLATC